MPYKTCVQLTNDGWGKESAAFSSAVEMLAPKSFAMQQQLD